MNLINLMTIFQAGLFYAIPWLIGSLVYRLVKRKNFQSYWWLQSYIYGCLIVYGLSLGIRYLVPYLELKYSFANLFFPLVLGLSLLALIVGSYRFLSLLPKITQIFWPIILGVIIYLIWIYKSPYSLNWDLYEHQTAINLILNNRFSVFLTQISDSFVFNSYTSIFHLLMAVSQYLGKSNIVVYWQAVAFFHLILVVLAAYRLAWEITHSRHTAIISSLLSVAVFEPLVTYTNLFLIPQTYTAVWACLMLAYLINQIKNNHKLPFIPLIFFSLFLGLNHYLLGALSLITFCLTYIYFVAQRLTSPAAKKTLVIVSFALLSMIIMVSYLIPLDFLNQGESAYYLLPLSQKFDLMRSAYGYLLILFVFIGVFRAIKEKPKPGYFLTIISLLGLGLMLSNLPYVLKGYALIRFLVHTLMAYGMIWLVKPLNTLIKKCLIFGFLGLILVIIFITNVSFWKQNLNYYAQQTHISDYELEAAQFLKSNYQHKNALLISDPATSYILETFSGINSQGGAYATKETRQLLHTAWQDGRVAVLKQKLTQINDSLEPKPDLRLFAYSRRYQNWQQADPKDKQAFWFNIWTPQDLTLADYQYLKRFDNSPFFIKKYQNPGVVIYELK